MTASSAGPADDPASVRALLDGLTELSARAGHDMVGPLNQAGSLLALFITRYRGKLDADADQLLDFLRSAAHRMEGVVEGLHSYMQSVGRPPVPVAVDLNELLAAALDRLQPAIRESGSVIESDTLPRASADPAHVITAFEQIIGNAIKFRRAGAPACIRISARRDGALVVVAVSDDGIGIDPEQNENVFLPFRRLNGREYPGAGLGLACVKTIVEMNGGVVRVGAPSEASTGARIEFALRAA